MMSFLRHRSRRDGYQGWALRVKGADKPLDWTTCTTRAECRQLRAEEGSLRKDLEIVKVKISVEVVGKKRPGLTGADGLADWPDVKYRPAWPREVVE